MSLFKKKYNYIGIDIGEKYIKLSQVKDVKGQITIENYKKEDISSLVSNGKLIEPIKIQSIIKDYIKDNVITNPYLIFSLQNKGQDYSLTKIFKINKLSKKEEQLNAINIELEDRFPLKEDFKTKHFYYDDINDSKKIIVYGTTYNKKIFDDYLAIMKDFNIPYEVISKNLLNSNSVSKDKVTMVVDIGYNHTDYLVYNNKLPLCVKNTNVGGNTITNIISTLGSIDIEKAEDIKISKGQMLTEIDVFSVIPDEQRQLSGFLEMQFNMIVNDIKRIMQQLDLEMDISIDNILITGGSSKTRFLEQFISENVGVQCEKLVLDFIGDNQDEEMMSEIQYFTNSILASYNKIQDSGLKLEIFEKEKDLKKLFIRGLVAFLVVFLMVNGVIISINTVNKKKLLELQNKKTQYEEVLKEVTDKKNEYINTINSNVSSINEVLSKKEMLESLTKEKKSYYPIIQIIKAHTPNDVQLDVLKIEKNKVSLKGIVNDYKNLGFYIKDLETVEGFNNIEFSFKDNKETRPSNKGDLIFTNLEFVISFNFDGDGTNFENQ